MIDKEIISNPKWKEKRREILKRDNFSCACCGTKTYKTLNVHHLKYIRGVEYWNHPNEYLITLCNDCHKKIHNLKEGKLKKTPEELHDIAKSRSSIERTYPNLIIEVKEDKRFPMFYFNGKKSIVYSYAYHDKGNHPKFGISVKCKKEVFKAIKINKNQFDKEIKWLIELGVVLDYRYFTFIFADVLTEDYK